MADFLKYKETYWRQTQFRRVEKEYYKPLVKKGEFLTGFIPRVKNYCISNNIPINIEEPPLPLIPYFTDDQIENITIPRGLKLKPDQVFAIKNILTNIRGVIFHPTGSGKTIIFLSFISLFPDLNSLIVVNTKDILEQTFERASEFFPKEVGKLGGGYNSPNRITIATIQTLKDIPSDSLFFKEIDIVVIDETHHCARFSKPFSTEGGGSYAKVLSSIDCPFKIGFTATLPHEGKGQLALEGYIGPVISKKKISEVERLAKIKVILKKLPITLAAREAKSYQEVYKYSVTFNSRRHKLVLQTADNLVKAGRTVLIIVSLVQHGNNILDMAHRLFPHLRIEFVWSKIPGTTRTTIKKDLNEGLVDVVIADAVWKEGVDIPTLGAIINAAGGKSEINTIQSLGRGLRTVPGIKDDVILVDILDISSRYLVEHFGLRLVLYFDEGWMGNEQF